MMAVVLEGVRTSAMVMKRSSTVRRVARSGVEQISVATQKATKLNLFT
jgi:hypothetical protein